MGDLGGSYLAGVTKLNPFIPAKSEDTEGETGEGAMCLTGREEGGRIGQS